MSMANQRLKKAMSAAHLSIDDVAREVQVDPKTVRRWVQGGLPYPRHRWTMAALLKEDEDYLWPAEDRTPGGAVATDELVDAYAQRALKPTDEWKLLLEGAVHRIDLLGYAMLHLPEQHPDLMQLLRAKGESGCHIRIALADPDSDHVKYRDAEEDLDGGLIARIKTARRYFADVEDAPNVEMRLHSTPMYNSIFRFDDEMFVTTHLFGIPGSKAPLFHLRKLHTNGIFEDYMLHFERIWQSAKQEA